MLMRRMGDKKRKVSFSTTPAATAIINVFHPERQRAKGLDSQRARVSRGRQLRILHHHANLGAADPTGLSEESAPTEIEGHVSVSCNDPSRTQSTQQLFGFYFYFFGPLENLKSLMVQAAKQ